MNFPGPSPPLNLTKPSKEDSYVTIEVESVSQCLERTNKKKKSMFNLTPNEFFQNTSHSNESTSNSCDVRKQNCRVNSSKGDHCLKSVKNAPGSVANSGILLREQLRPDGTDHVIVNTNTVIKVSTLEECPKGMDNFRTTIVGFKEVDECSPVEDQGPQQAAMCHIVQSIDADMGQENPSPHIVLHKAAHSTETTESNPKVPLKVLRSSRRSQIIHKCNLCSKVFKTASSLEKHSKESHSTHLSIKEIYKFNCDQCLATFQLESQLEQHLLTHTEEVKIFQATNCTTCNDPLNNYEEYRAHVKMHSKRYQCHECGMTFVQKSYLTVHSRSHTGEKPFKCNTCSAGFKQLSHLTTHTRTHTLEKPFNCTICPARFSQSSSMKRHIRTHTGDKPYVCQVCSVAFTDKRNLTRHMMSHEGKRPFKCNMCLARFTQKIDLIRHNLSHAGIKPFKCTLCSAAFSRQNNLRWHQRTHDLDATVENCAVCGVGFSNRRDLKQHLRQHSDSKPLTCKLCGIAVSCRFSLLRHMKTHNDFKPYSCSVCPAAFLQRATLKRHELRHKGIRAYKCKICGRAFFDSLTLKKHRVTVHGEQRFPKESSRDNGQSSGSRAFTKEKGFVSSGSYSASSCNSLPPQMADSNMQVSSNITIHSNTGLLSGDVAGDIVGSIIDEVEGGGGDEDDDEDPSSSFATTVVDIADSTPVGGTVTNGGTEASPTLVLSQPGMPSKTYRLAGDCQNHQNHVLTFLEGSTNQWQTWCFCNPQNLPNNSTSSSNNNIVNNGVQAGEATHGDTIHNNNNNNNNQSTHYFATSQDQQQNTFHIQPSSNATSNSLNSIETNCNLPSLQNTLTNGNYCQQQHYEYQDQFSSESINNEPAPVYTFTTDDNYPEVTPDVQMQRFHSRSSGSNIMSGALEEPQLERMDIKPLVEQFVPETSSSGGGNLSSTMDHIERKSVVSCSEGGDSGGLQYSLTVNNPATGNIQVTCDNFQPEFEVKTVTTSQGKKSKVYKCSICFRPFFRRVHMLTHMRRHTKEKPFQCKVCSVSFTHSNTLTAHMRSHTGEKPYKCSKCSASFAQKSNLTAHERIHSGEKPYRCDVCFMGFRQASHLPTHMRTHSNERPYQCSECAKRFTQKSALKRHMKTHSQTKTQVLLCGVCGIQIASEDYAEHMASHDGEEVREYPVAGRGQLFNQLDTLKRHLKKDHSDQQENVRGDPTVGDGIAEDDGIETIPKEKEEATLRTGRFSSKIEVATFKVTKLNNEKPRVQPPKEKKTNGVNKRKGKLKRSKKRPSIKKDTRKAKSVVGSSDKRKSAISSSRVSLRIKEAAGKKKSLLQENDYITGDLSDLDEHEHLTEFSNSCVDETECGLQNGNSKKGRLVASSAESDMGTWCFCEVPHASDQPHTSAQVPNSSVQQPAKSSEQTIVYTTQHSVSGIGIDGRGTYVSPQESTVPVTLSSESSIQLANDGTAEIFAFIDSKGQFVKASSGQILATKELTAVGELLTMGQTTNTSSNSIQVSGQSSDSSSLMVQHPQNISATSCYVSFKDISQSLMTSDGTVIQNEINMDSAPVPGQQRVHGSIQPIQSSVANISQQIIPLVNSGASSSRNSSFNNLTTTELEASSHSCLSVSSISAGSNVVHAVPETRVQIVGTVTHDGKMQLFNNDGQMQLIDAAAASSTVQMFDSLSAVQASHSGTDELLTQSGLATSSPTTTISGGYVVSLPGSCDTNQRPIQVLNSSSSIDVLPTSCQSSDAGRGSLTINTSTATTSSNIGSSVEVLLLDDKSQQHQTERQDCASSLFLEAAMVMQLQDNVFYNTTDGQMLQISGGSREVSTLNITSSPPPCSGSGVGETITYTIQGSAEVALQSSTGASSTTMSGGITVSTPLTSLPIQNMITTALPLVQSSILQSSSAGVMDYACQMCDKFFSHWREFINHVKMKHPNRHMCPVCYKVFDSADYLAAHTQESHPTKNNAISVTVVTATACPECKIDLNSKAKLSKHLRDVHNKGSRSSAAPRLRRVRREKSGVDDKLADDIKILNNRDDHPEEFTQDSLSSVTDEQCDSSPNKSRSKWSCNYCTETFGSHCDMARHKLQHTGEKPYKCSWCKASFTRKSSLNNHSRIHTGARPYSCTTCGVSFCYRYQYNRHRSSHDTEAVG